MADKMTIDTSPRGKIARGVLATEAARKGRRKPVLAHLVGAQTKPENLKVLLNGCRSRLSKLKAVRDAATTALADETAKIMTHYETEGYIVSDSGAKEDLLKDRRRILIDRAVLAAKKIIYSAIESDVTELMVGVREDERRVAAAKEAFPSMIAHLMNSTLSSEARHVYMLNLSAAGQTGLLGAAKEALANNDKALGAAVIASIDNLPKRSRDAMTISRDDLAEALVHEQFYAAVDKIVVAEFILAEAHLTGREGLGRQRTSTDTVGLGIKRTEVEAALGRPLTDDDSVWKNVIGGVEQKHEKKKTEQTEDQKEAAQRAEDLTAFHAAIQAGDNAKALRVGARHGWIEEINKGDEQ